MTRRVSSALLAAVAAAVSLAAHAQGPLEAVRYDGHKVVRATVRTEEELKTVLDITPDVWSHRVGLGDLDFRVTPEGLAALEKTGIPFRTLIDDVQQKIDAERAPAEVAARGVSWFDDYKNYAAHNAYVDTLVALRPDLAQRITLGNSLQGRPIFGLRITSSAGPATKPAAFFHGCQHAREWVAAATPMYIADRLIRDYDTDADIRRMVDNVEFFIVSISNPDGYEYSWTNQRLWRKNRRSNAGGTFGVDTNRNWGYEWGGSGASSNPGDDTYRGTAAFSEPETQALRDFMLAHANIRAHLDIHSYSQLVLAPWAYTTSPTPDAAFLNPLAQDVADGFSDEFDNPYTAGPTGQILYLAAGASTDWSYGAQGIVGFGVELRDTGANGFVLPASQIIPTGQETLAGVKRLVDAMLSPLVIQPAPALPQFASPNVAAPLSVSVIGTFGATVDAGSVKVFSRTGGSGPFMEADLAPAGGSQFTGAIAGAPCGASVEYYLQAATTEGVVETLPLDAPATPFSMLVGVQNLEFTDDFETNQGWTIGAPGDGATTGVWVRANPVGTAAQPEDDNPTGTGTQCFITGNGAAGGAVGTADVDNGATTLTSPAFDCSGGEAYLTYHRWYSDNGTGQIQDSLQVLISNDNGANWTLLEDVTGNPGVWVKKSWRVSDTLPPTAQVRLRFVARDQNPQSIVEAGVDDVSVVVLSCPPAEGADLDGSGSVGAPDLALLLGAWGPCPAPPEPCEADLDGDGMVGAPDLALLLGAWG